MRALMNLMPSTSALFRTTRGVFRGIPKGSLFAISSAGIVSSTWGDRGSAGTTTTCTSMASTGGSIIVVSDPKRPMRPPTTVATKTTTTSLRSRPGLTPSTPRMGIWLPGPVSTMPPKRASRTLQPILNSKAEMPTEPRTPLTRTYSMWITSSTTCW